MRRLKPVMILVGLGGCTGLGPTMTQNPPPPPSPERAAPDPGAITEVAADHVGELNATSEKLGTVFANKDGCFVRVPPEEPLPPGATGPTLDIPCPPSMAHPSFAECDFGKVVRMETGDCECQPWAGNPPPPNYPTDCPS